MEYKLLLIASYKHWEVYLHENQYFLGRVYIRSNREGLVDLMDVTEEERKELFQIGKSVRIALSVLYVPDLFNWASLGNIINQCHVHVIPRYKGPRNVYGMQFKDGRWGKNYAPYDYNFKIPDKILVEIKEDISLQLQVQSLL